MAILLFIAPATARADAPPRPTVLRADDTGVTLHWEFPAVGVTSRFVDNRPFSVLTMDGFPPAGTSGAPSLPRAGTLIGLPQGGTATAKITAIQTETITLPAPPLPAATFAAVGNPPQSVETIVPDRTLYGQNAFFPAEPIVLENPQQIRFQRVSRLTVNPVRVNPVSGHAVVIRAITVRVSFTAAPLPRTAAIPATDPISEAVTRSLANPDAARWQLSPTLRESSQADATVPEIKITIDRTGLYALSYADLSAAGLAVDTLDPNQLQLRHGFPRQTVSIWAEGGADGRFDPADRVLFFAEPTFSRTTDDDVYFLSVAENVTRPLSAVDDDPLPFKTYLPLISRSFIPVENLPAGAAQFSVTAEENRQYESHYPDWQGDHFFWQKLDMLSDRDITVPLTVDHPQNGTAIATVWLQGFTAGAHHVQVMVNGHTVADETWSGQTAHVITATVASGTLHHGENSVRVSLANGSAGAVWFDAVQLDYPARPVGGGELLFRGASSPHAYTFDGWQNTTPFVLDVTEPFSATRLKNVSLAANGTLSIGDQSDGEHRYFVAAESAVRMPKSVQLALSLSDPAAGADYIIITHPDFAAAVAPLAAHRAAQGLRVSTVDVRAIYDSFGDGRVSQDAIKTFLAHAFSSWSPPAPAYVLLVGDGHYDFKDYLGWGNPNFLPPFLAPVDPWLGETAADNRYVTLTGNDNFPDMAIGRLPVNSAAEAATVVDKILQYETNPLAGFWRTKELLVSDNCDAAGNFYNFNDFIYNNSLSLLSPARFYYPQDPGARCAYTDTLLYGDISSLRTEFLQAFNDGAGIIAFSGHSSWHQWAGGIRTTDEGTPVAEEPVFRWSQNPAENDVLGLVNGYRLPVILGLTCFTGYFQHPEYPTLDESVLRQSSGGAVAVWGATGLGVATGHDQLQAGFFDALIDDGERNLGALVLAGKAQLFANGFNQDLLDTFTLFGDPAFTANVTIGPLTNFVYLPLLLRDGG